MPAATISFFLPDPSLRWAISTFYFVDTTQADAPVRDLLHPEWANIRIAMTGVWDLGGVISDKSTEPVIYGPTSRTIPISSQGALGLGIGLLPGGWAEMIDAPASKYADRLAPLTEVMDEEIADAVRSVRQCADIAEGAARVNAYFLKRMADRPSPSPLVAKAHGVLMSSDVSTAAEFAAALDLSARQAHRLCLRMFGFPPQLLLRRQRFLRTLAVLRMNLDERWADLIDAHYYDQSHFVRDFHRFMGLSPSAYFALPREMLEPAAIARISHVGQPLQALQPPSSALSDSSNTA